MMRPTGDRVRSCWNYRLVEENELIGGWYSIETSHSTLRNSPRARLQPAHKISGAEAKRVLPLVRDMHGDGAAITRHSGCFMLSPIGVPCTQTRLGLELEYPCRIGRLVIYYPPRDYKIYCRTYKAPSSSYAHVCVSAPNQAHRSREESGERSQAQDTIEPPGAHSAARSCSRQHSMRPSTRAVGLRPLRHRTPQILLLGMRPHG